MSHGSWSSVEIQQLIADLTGQMLSLGTWREPKRFMSSTLPVVSRWVGK